MVNLRWAMCFGVPYTVYTTLRWVWFESLIPNSVL
jgi:hypothetical protein